MSFGLIVDLGLALLLGVAIGAMVLLMRRLAALRADRAEFARQIEILGRATAEAETGVRELRRGVEAARAGLGEPMSRAQALKDELMFLVERAERAARDLDAGVRQQRAATAEPPARARATPKPEARELPAALAQLR